MEGPSLGRRARLPERLTSALGPAARGARGALAAAILALVALAPFAQLLESGARETLANQYFAERSFWEHGSRADVEFEAWLVARNAKTLSSAPARLFDTEHCAPFEQTLTLGIPMITMGILGIPAWLATGDPILTYNSVLILMTWVAGFAMYLLVYDLTRSFPAALAAGCMYALQPVRLTFIHHPSVWDASWTVLAFFFARRLFAQGRWRDALGLAVATSLQIAASFYPFVTALLMSVPFGAWLLWRYRFEHVRASRLVAAALLVALAALTVLGPYLARQAGMEEFERTSFSYASWEALGPGGDLFPTWTALVLALVALFPVRAAGAQAPDGGARWALLAGGVVCLCVGLGSELTEPLRAALGSWVPVVNLHAMLSPVVPGLDAIRGILRFNAGVYIALCALSGIGLARLLAAPGARGAVAAAAVALAALDLFRPAVLGLPPAYRWSLFDAGAPAQQLELFERLEQAGSRGPIMELPIDREMTRVLRAPGRILLSIYHGRRTSACYGSYPPAGHEDLVALALELPSEEALEQVRKLGFRTIVVHHPANAPRWLANRFAAYAARPDAGLTPGVRTAWATSYEIDESPP